MGTPSGSPCTEIVAWAVQHRGIKFTRVHRYYIGERWSVSQCANSSGYWAFIEELYIKAPKFRMVLAITLLRWIQQPRDGRNAPVTLLEYKCICDGHQSIQLTSRYAAVSWKKTRLIGFKFWGSLRLLIEDSLYSLMVYSSWRYTFISSILLSNRYAVVVFKAARLFGSKICIFKIAEPTGLMRLFPAWWFATTENWSVLVANGPPLVLYSKQLDSLDKRTWKPTLDRSAVSPSKLWYISLRYAVDTEHILMQMFVALLHVATSGYLILLHIMR